MGSYLQLGQISKFKYQTFHHKKNKQKQKQSEKKKQNKKKILPEIREKKEIKIK